jgi:hypothetical protein
MPYGLQKLKGLYSGHITLVGNGPNLDVEKIEGMSLAMNSISLIFPKTSWRPDFYLCTSRELHQNPIQHKRIADVVATDVPCFLYSGYYPFFGARKNIYYISLGQPAHEPLEDDWMQNGIWFVCWNTTMVAAAQIAQYLHFDDTYNNDILPASRVETPATIEELNRRHKIAYEHIARMFGKTSCA